MKTDPNNSLGFLVSDIARMLRERFNITAQALGLTLAQARALVHLSNNEGISQVALAQRLEIQPITLMRQIDRLAESGLVVREPNPNDRRAQQLFLTTAADPLLEDINQLGSGLTDIAFEGMNTTQREAIITLLQQVKSNLSVAEHSGDVMPAEKN